MSYSTEAKTALCNAMWLLETLSEVRSAEEELHEKDSMLHVSVDDLLWASIAYVQRAWQLCEDHPVSGLSASVMQTVATLQMQLALDDVMVTTKAREK